MKLRRIQFLSAARSDYDLLAPIVKALGSLPEFEASVIACSAQLSPFHGSAIRQIKEDGFPLAGCIESLLASDTWTGRSQSFANLCSGLTNFFSHGTPDLLFLTGDREEHLAAAICAMFFQIPVAHLHGGDRCIASDIDEVVRPALSKLSHYHFTATEGHRQRLLRMGEENVWAVGAPGLDRLREIPEVSDGDLSQTAGFDVTKPFFLLIQHPSPMLDETPESLDVVLAGLTALGHPVLVSYPNADPGNFRCREIIDEWSAKNPLVHSYHNLPRPAFVSLLRRCAALAGNSSSLIIESSFLKKPALLCGGRQDLRERTDNVLRVECSKESVFAGCKKVLSPEFAALCDSVQSLYGDGYTSKKIVSILESLDYEPSILRKTMPY